MVGEVGLVSVIDRAEWENPAKKTFESVLKSFASRPFVYTNPFRICAQRVFLLGAAPLKPPTNRRGRWEKVYTRDRNRGLRGNP